MHNSLGFFGNVANKHLVHEAYCYSSTSIFFLFFHHPCIFFMFISYLFQSPDDSAISISNILRHHETEYLASLEVRNFLLIFKCLIIYSLVLTLNSHINRSLTPICQITHSRYRLVWEIYLLKTFLIFRRFSKQDLS